MFERICLERDYLRQVFSFILYNKIVDNLDAQMEMLDDLFRPHLWIDRLDEMEDLWFSIPMPKMTRDNFDFLAAKRKTAHMMGKVLREDQLLKYGIDYNDIPYMFETADKFMSVFSRLNMYGDRFRKEDLYLACKNGQTAMGQKETWHNFSLIVEILDRNGEIFTVDDFLRSKGRENAPLAYAAWNKSLDKIFVAEMWQGRKKEMLELWSYMKPAWVLGLDILAVQSELRSPLQEKLLTGWNKLRAVFGIGHGQVKTTENIFLRFCEGLQGEVCNQVIKNSEPVNFCLKMKKNRAHPQSCTIHKDEFPRNLQAANIA